MIFLKPSELRLLNSDFEQIIAGPDGTVITLSYETTAFPGATQTVDDAFGTIVTPRDPTGPKTLSIRAIHEIVKPRSLKLLAMGFLQIGDCIFYFSKNVNMTEPLAGYPAMWESMRLIDPDGVKWRPKILPSGSLGRLAVERVGSEQVCQALVCQSDL